MCDLMTLASADNAYLALDNSGYHEKPLVHVMKIHCNTIYIKWEGIWNAASVADSYFENTCQSYLLYNCYPLDCFGFKFYKSV